MALWPIFRVARALKIGQIADGGMPAAYETIH